MYVNSSPAGGTRNQAERGFTLIELLIAIGLLGLIAATTMFAFNGSKSKGQMLFSAMDNLSQAVERYEVDTSCIPFDPTDLFTNGSDTNNSCGEEVTSAWDGPYAKPLPVSTSGTTPGVELPQIGPQVTLTIAAADPTVTGVASTNQYAIFANDVPASVAQEAMKACNGMNTGDSDYNPCITTGSSTGDTTSFEYVFGFSD